jgi:hypothetical protein
VTPSEYRYLTQATNRLLSLCGDSSRRSAEDLAFAATQACEALKLLQKQQAFHEMLDQSARNAPATAHERAELRAELASLANSFVNAEARALKKMGHSKERVKQILWMAAGCQDAVSQEVSVRDLVGKIHDLELACCSAANELHKAHDDQSRRRRFGRITFGMAGVSVMLADLVAIPVTGATSIGSVAIGGAMVGKSLG